MVQVDRISFEYFFVHLELQNFFSGLIGKEIGLVFWGIRMVMYSKICLFVDDLFWALKHCHFVVPFCFDLCG